MFFFNYRAYSSINPSICNHTSQPNPKLTNVSMLISFNAVSDICYLEVHLIDDGFGTYSYNVTSNNHYYTETKQVTTIFIIISFLLHTYLTTKGNSEILPCPTRIQTQALYRGNSCCKRPRHWSTINYLMRKISPLNLMETFMSYEIEYISADI